MTTMLSVVFCVATISLALLGWLCKTWTEFGLCSTAPFILLFAYSFFVPESPRWLITQGSVNFLVHLQPFCHLTGKIAYIGRFDDAVKIIERMARWQNIKIDLVALRRAMVAGAVSNQNQNNQPSSVESAIVANISDKGSASSTAALLPMMQTESGQESIIVVAGGDKKTTTGVDETRSIISDESAGTSFNNFLDIVHESCSQKDVDIFRSIYRDYLLFKSCL